MLSGILVLIVVNTLCLICHCYFREKQISSKSLFTLFISCFSFSSIYLLILMLKYMFLSPHLFFFFSKRIKHNKSSQVLFTQDCYLFILATYDDFPGFAIKGYCLLFLLSPLIYIKEFDINQTFILSSYLCFCFFFSSGSN